MCNRGRPQSPYDNAPRRPSCLSRAFGLWLVTPRLFLAILAVRWFAWPVQRLSRRVQRAWRRLRGGEWTLVSLDYVLAAPGTAGVRVMWRDARRQAGASAGWGVASAVQEA